MSPLRLLFVLIVICGLVEAITLDVKQISNTSVSLTWTPQPGATIYYVQNFGEIIYTTKELEAELFFTPDFYTFSIFVNLTDPTSPGPPNEITSNLFAITIHMLGSEPEVLPISSDKIGLSWTAFDISGVSKGYTVQKLGTLHGIPQWYSIGEKRANEIEDTTDTYTMYLPVKPGDSSLYRVIRGNSTQRTQSIWDTPTTRQTSGPINSIQLLSISPSFASGNTITPTQPLELEFEPLDISASCSNFITAKLVAYPNTEMSQTGGGFVRVYASNETNPNFYISNPFSQFVGKYDNSVEIYELDHVLPISNGTNSLLSYWNINNINPQFRIEIEMDLFDTSFVFDNAINSFELLITTRNALPTLQAEVRNGFNAPQDSPAEVEEFYQKFIDFTYDFDVINGTIANVEVEIEIASSSLGFVAILIDDIFIGEIQITNTGGIIPGIVASEFTIFEDAFNSFANNLDHTMYFIYDDAEITSLQLIGLTVFYYTGDATICDPNGPFPSASVSPTPTPTPSQTPTKSFIHTTTSSISNTPSPTPTSQKSFSATRTQLPTNTGSPTPTATLSLAPPSNSPSSSLDTSATSTQSATPSASLLKSENIAPPIPSVVSTVTKSASSTPEQNFIPSASRTPSRSRNAVSTPIIQPTSAPVDNGPIQIVDTDGNVVVVVDFGGNENPDYTLTAVPAINNNDLGSSFIDSSLISLTLLDGFGFEAQPTQGVEICFEKPQNDDACLGFLNEETSPPRWECEDTCLEESDDGFLCGTTDHFTNFALLLSGGDNGCEAENDLIFDEAWKDGVLIGAVTILILLCLLIATILLALTPLGDRILRGKEGRRVQKLRTQSTGSSSAIVCE